MDYSKMYFNIKKLNIEEVMIIRTRKYCDKRGFFSPIFSEDLFKKIVPDCRFMEDYVSGNRQAGVVRGLHYQLKPHAQPKLVHVIRGSIFDVVVDIRQSSPTFGKHLSICLSSSEGDHDEQLFVPEGFAHGFCTLEPNTLVAYKAAGKYCEAAQFGIQWNDPDLGIEWPIGEHDAIISSRDSAHPPLRLQNHLFD